MKPDRLEIALIGCGKMGGAMLRGWQSAGILKHAHVLDPAGAPAGKDVTHYKDAIAFTKAKPDAKIFVLAVKPQVMDDTCKSIAPVVPADALIISIAAGQTIASFEKRFNPKQPIVRSMPNLPASIGKGITVAVANKNVSAAQKKYADAVLHAGGMVEWVEDEKLLDPVTALSGSGPAYVFLLIEAMAEAGAKAGLSADLAMQLARQTVIGAGALAEADSTAATTLRKNVTSPGGTTEAALKVLMDTSEFQNLLNKAISAASARARELSR